MTKSNTAIALVMPSIGESDVPAKTWEEVRADLFAEFHTLGESMARGAMSKTDAAIRFSGAVREGHASVATKGSDDAERIYLAIANAHNAAIADRKDVDLLPVDAKGSKSAISVFRTFGKSAVIAQGADWFARVSRVRDSMGPRCKRSAYLALWTANKSVVAESSKLIGNRVVVATDEMIEAWLEAAPPSKDTEAEALEKFALSMSDLSHDYSFGADVESAMELLRQACYDRISYLTQLFAN
jgi:hypothetical protein